MGSNLKQLFIHIYPHTLNFWNIFVGETPFAEKMCKYNEVVERLDGLDFSFGPASFQQVNLQVFEKILQECVVKACETTP